MTYVTSIMLAICLGQVEDQFVLTKSSPPETVPAEILGDVLDAGTRLGVLTRYENRLYLELWKLDSYIRLSDEVAESIVHAFTGMGVTATFEYHEKPEGLYLVVAAVPGGKIVEILPGVSAEFKFSDDGDKPRAERSSPPENLDSKNLILRRYRLTDLEPVIFDLLHARFAPRTPASDPPPPPVREDRSVRTLVRLFGATGIVVFLVWFLRMIARHSGRPDCE